MIRTLAQGVGEHASRDDTQHAWLPAGGNPDPRIVADVAVWRAATGVHPDDPRPTGPRQPDRAANLHQHQLTVAIMRSAAAGSPNRDGQQAARRYARQSYDSEQTRSTPTRAPDLPMRP